MNTQGFADSPTAIQDYHSLASKPITRAMLDRTEATVIIQVRTENPDGGPANTEDREYRLGDMSLLYTPAELERLNEGLTVWRGTMADRTMEGHMHLEAYAARVARIERRSAALRSKDQATRIPLRTYVWDYAVGTTALIILAGVAALIYLL